MLNHCLLYSTYFKINFYWSRVALQSYFSFCCTAKWLYVYIYSLFFRFLFLLKSPQSIGQSSLSYTIRSHQLSLLYISSAHASILKIFILDKVVDGIVYITYIPTPSPTWDLLLLPVKKLVFKISICFYLWYLQFLLCLF